MTFSAEVCEQLANQAMEVPSWAYGNSGTRFKVFAQPGVPRDPYEKVADAAQVHALNGTGSVPRNDQLQHVPERHLQAGITGQPRRVGPTGRDRSSPAVHRDHA